MEQWKPIPDRPAYQVSDLGRVRGLKGQILRTKLAGKGYEAVTLGRYYYRYVHRCVAGAFLGEIPAKMVVNHKNGDKTDNRLENLEVVTYSDNLTHDYYVLGRKKSRALLGRKAPHPRSKITEDDVRAIRNRAAQGETINSIRQAFGLSYAHTQNIILRRSWAYLD